MPLNEIAKSETYSREYAESNGFLTLLSDGERLTGAYALGPEAGEWLQQATLAIRARVPLDVLRDTIQPFPTFSEIYVGALKALLGEIAPARQPVPTAAAMSDLAVTPLARLRSPTGVALIVATVLASGVASYDAYVVNVAIPAIGRDLGASVTALQWTLTSYLLTVGGLLLLAGALADRFGRRRILVSGLLLMFVASILCAVAPSTGALIGARVVQGVGAALVVPTSLALLNGTLQMV